MSTSERLTNALTFANYKTAMHTRKMHLKLQLEDELSYAVSGGVFTIDRELISFVDSLISRGHTEAVLIDSRTTPILIEDLSSFIDVLISKYFEATNSYHRAIVMLNKARTVEQIAAI